MGKGGLRKNPAACQINRENIVVFYLTFGQQKSGKSLTVNQTAEDNQQPAIIRAVFFDLGETIFTFSQVNTSRLFYHGAKLSYEFLKSLNQPTGPFNFYFLRNLISIRLHVLLSAITGNDFNSLTLLRKLGAKKGYRLNDQQWVHYAWLWYEPLSKFARTEPDIIKTLTALKQQGLKLGILSNTFINSISLEKHLQQCGILDFFSAIMFSYQFDFRKPDVKIFKAAAEKIGEKCKNILFVGDHLDNDIYPALKAGMHAALKTAYTNRNKKTPPNIFKIDKLSELPGLIEKINKH
jgi:HAD superfamily hydrolase (TIGR01549 family)